MPRGRGGGGGGRVKRTHKGGYRSFSSEDELRSQADQIRKDRELRGENIDEEEEPKAEGATAEGGEAAANSSDEESSEDDSNDRKGVAGLIEIENPNRVKGASKLKKVSEISTEGDAQLSRKEREEIERQRAKAAYLKAHLAGQTDEARADLARLAIIRQQREEAARKRDSDKKAPPKEPSA